MRPGCCGPRGKNTILGRSAHPGDDLHHLAWKNEPARSTPPAPVQSSPSGEEECARPGASRIFGSIFPSSRVGPASDRKHRDEVAAPTESVRRWRRRDPQARATGRPRNPVRPTRGVEVRETSKPRATGRPRTVVRPTPCTSRSVSPQASDPSGRSCRSPKPRANQVGSEEEGPQSLARTVRSGGAGGSPKRTSGSR